MFFHKTACILTCICAGSVSSFSLNRPVELISRGYSAGSNCCAALQRTLGAKIIFPTSPQYANQQNGSDGYWTQQEADVSPACRVSATSEQDVATAVSTLAHMKCLFAVRSGGHMGWAGAANIENGVTIDLSAINQVIVSGDRLTTSVGPGARWEDVYLKLDAMNLAVSGGRASAVGVGGLTLGGGNSFFAPRVGFACDGVANFQVVLASGAIVNANLLQNTDLFRALKGGGNNFGIVTRFDLRTFSQGKLWGGFVINSPTTATQQFQYLQDFTTASGDGVDNYATVINAYIFGANGPEYIANQFTYTKPMAYPAILQNFTNISPQIENTLRITNLTDLTIEVNAGTPNGFRQLFGTATFQNNAAFFADMYAIAESAFQPVQGIKDFQASFVLQPIPKSITTKAELTGGNSLGLLGNVDLVWLDLTIQWSLASDDSAVNAAVDTLLSQSIALAKSKGLYNNYLYMNYALQSQDPIASYGLVNKVNLEIVSRIYDPKQVFQQLVPGGFKLNR